MDLMERIFNAGIVGCGGAGFPTHVKLNTKARWLIINGAECEPLLRTDRYVMRHEASQLLEAAELIGDFLEAKHIVIALKAHYEEERKALEAAAASMESKVKLHFLENFYPAGDEQVLVQEVTGKIVPPAGLPGDVGAVVSNVSTVRAVLDAVEGIPFTHKYLTVTGQVENPVIVKAPIGTPIRECLEAAGTLSGQGDYLLGGPLMGKLRKASDLERDVVTKTTSGVIVVGQGAWLSRRRGVPIEHMLRQAKAACIQCSHCTELCSRHMLGHPLEPHKIMRKFAMCADVDQVLEDEDVKQALICSECGICEEYACPMGLQPRRINSLLKTLYRKESFHYNRKETHDKLQVNAMRQYRKVPSERLAARLGLHEFYHLEIDRLVKPRPKTVAIPIRQHIGAPSQPVVKAGDAVCQGQLIAKCPEGSLGANIHASITGTVLEAGERIIIKG